MRVFRNTLPNGAIFEGFCVRLIERVTLRLLPLWRPHGKNMKSDLKSASCFDLPMCSSTNCEYGNLRRQHRAAR